MSQEVRVFVHVPKTAGTSFRMALEERLGFAAMAYDYGPDSPITSPVVRRHVYEAPDLERFAAAVADSPVQIVCGHFFADKYLDLFSADRTLIFLRDPIQRLISEFQHFVKLNGYTKGFEDFYQDPAFIDRQLDFVAGVPVDQFAFLGITERYDESLALANSRFGWQLRNLALNMARPSLEADYEMEGEAVQDVLDRNARDIAFYAEALELFSGRVAQL